MSRERRRQLVVDHPHHLLGGDPVGDHAGDEGPGAGSHVDVELVDGPVDGQQVERAQGADLVHATGEPAAAQDQRGLRSARRRPLLLRAPRDSVRGVSSSTTFPMEPCPLCRDQRLRLVAPVRGRLAGDRAWRRSRACWSRRPCPRPRRSPRPACTTGLAKQMQPRGRRQRRLRHATSTRAATERCSAGHRAAAGSWPRTRSCSRWRRCSTGSARRARLQDQALRTTRATRSDGHTLRGSLVVVGAGDPALGKGRVRAPPRPPADTARRAGRRRPQGRHQAGDAARSVPTTRSSTAAGASRPPGWTPRASSGRCRASPTTRASSTATTRGIRSWSQRAR